MQQAIMYCKLKFYKKVYVMLNALTSKKKIKTL